jgi:NADPH2:quinone reductase
MARGRRALGKDMKALLCKSLGLPDTLVYEEVADPVPGAGEVVVEMKAAGVNFPDALVIQGKYQFKPPLPFVPGAELAGIVSAVGEGVKNARVGDRVIGSCQYGAFAEKVIVRASHLIPLPPGISYEVGASFTLAYGTSYHALKGRAGLKAGETLLVLGAAGGVGLAAVQIGRALGARVIAAASTPEKLAICRENGADELINYASEDLRQRIKALTGGKGPDVIYDPVGGRYAEPAFRSIGWGGRYLVVGFADGQIPSLPLNLPLLKGASVVGVFWGEFVARQLPDFVRDLTELFALIAQGKLRPHISARYPLAQGAKALEELLARRVTGKVVITNGDAAETGRTAVPQSGMAAASAAGADTAGPAGLPEGPLAPADLGRFAGQTIGTSQWLALDQALIDDFADCTGDHQWIHVDRERAARESPFGGTVAHGFLTLSLIPTMSHELLVQRVNATQMVNYGLDRVRFVSPVRAGARIRNRVTIASVEDRGMGRWLLTTENTVEIEGEEKPAVVAVQLVMLS